MVLLRIKNERIYGKFKKYLESLEIPFTAEYRLEEDCFALFASPSCEEKVKNAWGKFLEAEKDGEFGAELASAKYELSWESGSGDLSEEELLEEASVEDVAKELLHPSGGAYESMESKAQEAFGSAIMLVITGHLGTVYAGLNIAGVLSHFAGLFSQVLLLTFFLVLLAAGIYTAKQYRTYKKKSEEEAVLLNKINQWMKDNFDRAVLEQLAEENASPEENAVICMDFMAKRLLEAYPEISENAAYQYIEEFYNSTFSSEQNA